VSIAVINTRERPLAVVGSASRELTNQYGRHVPCSGGSLYHGVLQVQGNSYTHCVNWIRLTPCVSNYLLVCRLPPEFSICKALGELSFSVFNLQTRDHSLFQLFIFICPFYFSQVFSKEQHNLKNYSFLCFGRPSAFILKMAAS
jgi:hypothetical protein